MLMQCCEDLIGWKRATPMPMQQLAEIGLTPFPQPPMFPCPAAIVFTPIWYLVSLAVHRRLLSWPLMGITILEFACMPGYTLMHNLKLSRQLAIVKQAGNSPASLSHFVLSKENVSAGSMSRWSSALSIL